MSMSVRREHHVHSRCVQLRVKDVCKDSISIFSSKGYGGEIPLVLIPGSRSALSLAMTVPSGCYALIQKWGRHVKQGEDQEGKPIDHARAGLYFPCPFWTRTAYLVSKQACTYDAPVMQCATADYVRVSVDVVLVFKITQPYDFVYRLGAKNFDELLSATVDEAIRIMVRRHTSETVYNIRGDQEGKMLTDLNKKFEECGVTFQDVKITSVWLPDNLAQFLEETTKMEKAMETLKVQNQFEILQIQQKCDIAVDEIQRKCEQTLVSETGQKRKAELEFEQRSVKAEEEAKVALIDAERKQDVMLLEVNAALKRKGNELEKYRIEEIAKAEAKAMASKIQAEHVFEAATIEAKWREEQDVCEAQAIKYNAAAEKEALKSLAAKRRQDLLLREMDILGRLAEEGHFNLVGTPGDKIISAMMDGSFKK